MNRFFKVVAPELLMAGVMVAGIGGAAHAYFLAMWGLFGFGLAGAIVSGVGLIASCISWVSASDNGKVAERIAARLEGAPCRKCAKLEQDNAKLLQRASEAEQALVKLRIE